MRKFTFQRVRTLEYTVLAESRESVLSASREIEKDMAINSDLETEDIDVWEVPETAKPDIVISPEGELIEPESWAEREEEYESQQRERELLSKNLPLFDK
jgi:hypothetical protein